MADEADALDEEQDEAPEIENEEDEQPDEEGGDEEIVLFGEEPAPAAGADTGLARHLRAEIAKRDRELADLRQRAAPQQIELGEEPSLDDPEIAYDQDKFKEAWRAWNDRKAKAEQQRSQVSEQDQQFRTEWERDHQSYQAKRANLTFADRDATEAVALGTLSPAQQVAIVQVADNPALLLYALGKHPEKLAQIAAVSNPLKLAKEIATLERTISVTQRRRAPDPERIPSGTARINHESGDKKLERLEKAAEKSGDRTELIAYKSELRRKAQQKPR